MADNHSEIRLKMVFHYHKQQINYKEKSKNCLICPGKGYNIVEMANNISQDKNMIIK